MSSFSDYQQLGWEWIKIMEYADMAWASF